jgi:tRNA dimethylallyltransferase
MHLIGDRQPPLIVILGPTAVGKTGLATKIAQGLRGEIVGADSRQVYRYMDIGTAKPTVEEQRLVPHHLIDLIDPPDTLSLATYQQLAYDTINAIHDAGYIPLLVGGTGQYLSAVTEGWSIPEVPPNYELRTELEQFAEVHGADALHARLKVRDPIAARKIHPNNVRRVVRALEVSIESGQPISEMQQKRTPPYRILEIGLDLDREKLYERANSRVDVMMANGLLDEVKHLLDMGFERTLPAMSGLGYAQLVAHLLDGVPLEEAVQATKSATHDFIRRQYTWFRGHDNGILWHNVDRIHAETIVQICAHWLQRE